jgi:Kef-type K+ transport system membrane component KefB
MAPPFPFFSMNSSGPFLLDLFLIFAGGKLFAEGCERLRQPPAIGEIVAGVLLGPSLLGLVQVNPLLRGLAEVGAIFLLFTVGLETKPRDLVEHGWTAALVAILGMAIPFAGGYVYLHFTRHSRVESVFVGASMVATSVGITARVLADMNRLRSRLARVILAAAVLDDILGMIVLAVVSSLSSGRVNMVQLAAVAAEAIGFSALVIAFGSRVVGRLRPAVGRLRIQNSAFLLSITLCLGLSLASAYVGMAAMIGAFLAGLALAESSEVWRLEANARPLREFLTPFFFVLLGVMVDARGLLHPQLLSLVAVVSFLAIAGKIIGCGLGAVSLGAREALAVGVGMVPRGEVGLIITAVGLNLHAISTAIYAVVLLMSVITTLVAPPALRWLLGRWPAAG